jgi:hypothetical protein
MFVLECHVLAAGGTVTFLCCITICPPHDVREATQDECVGRGCLVMRNFEMFTAMKIEVVL